MSKASSVLAVFVRPWVRAVGSAARGLPEKERFRMGAIEIIPSARRLIRSLRDMGYDFAQAVADVVDNSIEAGASEIRVDIEFDGDGSWVRIADNGKGMKPDELREALRFGADRAYDDDDLGKFGLGLKTASLSQCQHLAVASRWNPDRADIAGYAWDLDHISKTDRWEIVPLERDGVGPGVRNLLKDGPGTVVLWHRLDRLLGYKHPYGEAARKRLQEMCRDLELHLGMVFERFIAGRARGKKLKLFLNGNAVSAWDPFCRSESKTKMLQSIELPLEFEGVKGSVSLEPFVLPAERDFASPESWRRASGPNGWNQQQGFYVYRSHRMIQSGGWSNLRAPDEHVKLARIAVSFSPRLDEAFKVNVAKMRVQMPAALRDEIKKATASVVKIAREVYDRKAVVSHTLPSSTKSSSRQPSGAPVSTGNPNPAIHFDQLHASSGFNSHSSPSPAIPLGPDITQAFPLPPDRVTNAELLTPMEWARKLMKASEPEEQPIIDRVLRRMGLPGMEAK
jgi:hypothetical protein